MLTAGHKTLSNFATVVSTCLILKTQQRILFSLVYTVEDKDANSLKRGKKKFKERSR